MVFNHIIPAVWKAGVQTNSISWPQPFLNPLAETSWEECPHVFQCTARNLLAVLSYHSAASTPSVPVFPYCPCLFLIHTAMSKYTSTPTWSVLRTTSFFFRLRNFFPFSNPSPLQRDLTACCLSYGHPAFGALLTLVMAMCQTAQENFVRSSNHSFKVLSKIINF